MSGIQWSNIRFWCASVLAVGWLAGWAVADGHAEPSHNAPVVKSVAYTATVQNRHLKVTADVALWQAKSQQTRLFLPLGPLALASADLDGQPAAILRAKRNVTGVELLQEAAGDSRLRLTMSTPLHAAGTDRLAVFPLIANAASSIRIHVPAGQSLLVDGQELQRPKPKTEAADYQFAAGNRRQIAIRLTDGKSSRTTDPLLLATSRAHLAISAGLVHWTSETQLQISGPALRDVTLSTPGKLHVSAVSSPDIASWTQTEPADGESRNVVRVRFRRPISGHQRIRLTGAMNLGSEAFWNVPNLIVTGADSHAGQIAVRFPSQESIRVDEYAGLQQTGTANDPSAVQLIPVTTGNRNAKIAGRKLAFNFWRQDYELVLVVPRNHRADTADAATKLAVRRDHVALEFRAVVKFRQKPKRLRFTLPAGWELRSVRIDDRNADWSQKPLEADVQHISVALPVSTSVQSPRDSAVRLHVTAARQLELAETADAAELPIPELRLTDSRMQLGTVTVQTAEPLDLHTTELKGLKAVASELAAEQLAFRYVIRGNDRPAIAGNLSIRPRPADLSADSVAVQRLNKFHLTSQHKFTLQSQGVGYEALDIRVPAETGSHAKFQLLDTNAKLLTAVAQPPKNNFRTWTLRFDRPLRGSATLAVQLKSPRPEQPTQPVVGHRVEITQATSHTGVFGVEANDHCQLNIAAVSHSPKKAAKEKAKSANLEEVSATDFSRITGHASSRLVAAYRFLSPNYSVSITETVLPAVNAANLVCRQQSLQSIVSTAGEIQNRIVFDVDARGVHDVRVQLPADAVLWAALRDGSPVEARRIDDVIVIPLNLSAKENRRQIEMIYQTRTETFENLGRFRQTAPLITFLATDGKANPVEIRERTWEVYHAEDVALLKSTGQFQPTNALDQSSWLTATFAPATGQDHFSLTQQIALFAGFLLAVTVLALSYRRFGQAGIGGVLAVVGVITLGFLISRIDLPHNGPDQSAASIAATDHAKTEAKSSSFEYRQRTGYAMTTSPRAPSEEPQTIAPDYGTITNSLPFAKARQAEVPKSKPVPNPVDELAFGNNVILAESDDTTPQRTNRARLSVAVAFAPPQNAVVKQFRYAGAETEGPVSLVLSYETKRGGLMQRLCLITGIAMLFWWVRHRSVSFRGRMAFLGVVVPAMLVGWAPTSWLPTLDGVFLGTVAGCTLWGLLHLMKRIRREWRQLSSRSMSVAVAKRNTHGILIASAIWLSVTSITEAADPAVSAAKPAVGFVSAANYEIDIQAPEAKSASAVINARYTIHNLQSGATAVAVPLGRAAIASSTLNGKPASLFWRKTTESTITKHGGESLAVLVPTTGRHTLQIQFAIPLTKTANGSTFTVPVKPVAAGRATVRRPTDGNRLVITGVVGTVEEKQGAGTTVMTFPVDQARNITFQLQRLGTTESPRATVGIADATSDVEVTDHGVRQHDRLTLQVRNGSISEWSFRLPAERKLLAITGSNIAGWTFKTSESGERIAHVQFQKPVTKSTEVIFDLMKPAVFSEESVEFSVLRVIPDNVSPFAATVSLTAGAQFHVQAVATANAKALSPQRSKPRGRLSRFRYRVLPSKTPLTFGVTRRQPQTEIVAEHAVVVDHDAIRISSRLTADLKGFPRSKLVLFLPEGFTLDRVRGDHDAEWSLGEDETMLIILFPKPQADEVRVTLQGRMRRDPKSATAELTLPAPMMAHRLKTIVGLWGSPGLTVAPQNVEGWTALTKGEIPSDLRLRVSRQPVAGFLSRQLEPSTLSVALAPQKADIQARAVTFITLSNSSVHYTTLFKWSGLTGNSQRVSVRGPAWLGGKWKFQTGRSTRALIADGKKIPADQTRWAISQLNRNQREIVAVATATIPFTMDNASRLAGPVFTFEQAVAAENDGQQETFQPIAQTRQHVVVVNRSNQRVQHAVTSKHRTVADRDLLADWNLHSAGREFLATNVVDRLAVDPAAGAPTWYIRRTRRRLGVAAAVNRAELTTLLDADGTWRLRAVYRMKNRNRRFLAVKLPKEARLNRVLVAGQVASVSLLKRKDATWHLVPLQRTASDEESFGVQLLLSGRFSAGALPRSLQFAGTRLELPAVQVVSLDEDADWGIPVEETVWRVRLPTGFRASAETDSDITNLKPISTTSAFRELDTSNAKVTGVGRPKSEFLLDDAALQERLENWSKQLLQANEHQKPASGQQRPAFAFPLQADGVIGQFDDPVRRISFRREQTDRKRESLETHSHLRHQMRRYSFANDEQARPPMAGFDLPDDDTATVLTFRKTGGDPRLTLAIQPKTLSQSGWQILWTVSWVIVGVFGWRSLRDDNAARRLLRITPYVLLVFGTLMQFSLTGPLSLIGMPVAATGIIWIAIHFCRNPTTGMRR